MVFPNFTRAFDTPPTLVGTADRVASTTFYRIGAGTSQGPGKVICYVLELHVE